MQSSFRLIFILKDAVILSLCIREENVRNIHSDSLTAFIFGDGYPFFGILTLVSHRMKGLNEVTYCPGLRLF